MESLGNCQLLAVNIIERARRDWETWRLFTRSRRYEHDPEWVCSLYASSFRRGWSSPRDELIGFFRGPWCRFLWESVTEVPIEHMYKELNIDKVQACQISIRVKGAGKKRCLYFKPQNSPEGGGVEWWEGEEE